MKRGLRIVMGIVVLVAMTFFYGFAADRGNALAAGAGDPPQAEPRGWNDGTRPEGSQDMREYFLEHSSGEKASTKNTKITSNTTISSRTYNSNVLIYPDVTLTVGTNANVIVNGDVYVLGALKMSSGTLTVNGDILVVGSFIASGSSKVIVNKASSTYQEPGYPGGNIAILDGTMRITGSANVTINKVSANTGFYDFAYLVMDSASARMTVNGVCVFDGESTSGKLTAGTLVVNGNFYQQNEVSDQSFCPGSSFKVSIVGAAGVKREVDFDSPGGSYFNNYTFINVMFTGYSRVSFQKILSSDATIVCNAPQVAIQGDLRGHKLSVTAKYPGVQAVIYPAIGSTIRFGGGTLTLNTDEIFFERTARVLMSNSSDKLIANGSFTSESENTGLLTAGCLEVRGNYFSQSRAFSPELRTTYTPGPNFVTRLCKNGAFVSFTDPEYSYFTKLELAPGASLLPGSDVPIKYDLTEDTQWSYPNLNYRGSLNGHTLKVNGDLTVPASNTLTVGGGLLEVDGNLTVTGDLVMADPSDRVTVSGNFTANSSAASTDLSDGKLYIAGNFAQSGHAASFLATGDHMTILNGTAAQTVNFASASSRFATLVVTHDDLDPSSILPTYYSSLQVTGTTLDSITTDVGALSPGFGADIHEYNVLLPTGTNSVTITPELLDRYAGTAWLTEGDGTDPITSVTVTNVPYDGVTTVTVKVHAYQDVEIATYTFRVMQINPDLASLGDLPAGSVLEPAFDPTVHSYTVQLPETAASFAWAPEADHPDSAVHIDAADGPPSVTVALAPGESADYVAGVTAQDGVTEGSYSVTFMRRNPVAGITASAGTLTPAFSAGTANYTVYVPASVPSVTIAALKDDADPDPDWSKFTINDVEQSEITLSPDPGTSAIATIKAWDADNKTVTTYTVTVNRVKMLSGITTSAGALTPTFDAATGSYSVYVSGSVTSVKITPAKTASCTALKINGKIASYVTLLPAAGGKLTATIDCTGTGAVTQRYVVNVYRIAPITGITITGGKLSPTFSTATTVYTVSVPATTSAVTVKPVMTASYKAGTLTINGSAVSYVTLRPAVGGSLQAKIRAQAVNGVWYAYTVTVKRAALLTGVRVSPGTLSPAFKPTVLAYTVVRVPATATQVKITPVKASSGVKSVTINGRAVSYAYIKPPVGGSANCTIVATASDGRTKITYTIKVTRDPLISAIRTSVGALTPAFSPTRTTYTINVPATASSVTITPVKTAYTKTLTIDNKVQSYKRVSPPLGGSVTCTIVATATDGRTKSTYTVRVVRHRPITGITVADGSDPTKLFTLSPAFSPTTLEYNVTVPGGTPQVTITPAKASGYSFSVNGGLANMPGTVTVPPGGTTTAYIVATYPGGSILYKVNVHREDLLTNITVSAGSLNPSFSAAVAEYEVLLDADTASTRITPVGSGCQFAINGDEVEYLDVTLEPGGEQVITIVVTTSVPGEELTYTVTVRRAGP